MTKYSLIDADRIFDQALKLPTAERQAFIENSSNNNEALKTQVLKLLKTHESLGSFLEGDAEQKRDSLYSDISAAWSENSQDRIETKVGNFRIVKEIGRGGGSTVYQGVREEQDWQQESAIKILRRGLDTDDVLQRFHVERQILSKLKHPGISSIHDAGVTEDGLPWFAMELVEGENIFDYCQNNLLSLKQRLKLFLQVVEIVGYAHQHLIVHRDIKPSNILVTNQSKVKLLDFGISKVLKISDEELLKVYTRTGINPSTPNYAAPEQLAGDQITTTTDIYQLGLLLCKILTGLLPIAPTKDREIHHQEQLQKPSDLKSKIQSVSSRDLRGDLDTIILKALRQEPEQRYASTDTMVKDIERYLTNRPIEAQKPSLLYRFKKLIQRQPWAMPVAMLASLGFIAYFITIVIYSKQLQIEKDLKTMEAMRAEEIKSFLVEFLLIPDPHDGKGSDVTIIEAMLFASQNIETELENQPYLQAEIYGIFANVYQNLELHKEALSLWSKQIQILQLENEEPVKLLIIRSVRAMSIYREKGKEQAVVELEKINKAFSESNPNYFEERATVNQVLGIIEMETGEIDKSIHYFEQAEKLVRKTSPPNRDLLARILLSMANVKSNQGEFQSSIDLTKKVELIFSELYGKSAIETLQASQVRAINLMRTRQDPEEALALFLAAHKEFEKVFGSMHAETTTALGNAAYVYRSLKEYSKAEEIYRKTLKIRLEQYGDEPSLYVAYSLLNLGKTLHLLEKNIEALKLLKKSRTMIASIVDPNFPRLATVDTNLTNIYSALKKYAEMEKSAKRALDILDNNFERGNQKRELAQCRYAVALGFQGKKEKAKTLLIDALDALNKVDGSKNIIEECNDYLEMLNAKNS